SPWITVSVLPLGRAGRGGRMLPGAPAIGAPTRACLGGSWVSAFFLEGFGPRPTAPAMLYVRSDDSLYSLRIDHERDLLRATPALQVLRRDVLSGLAPGEHYSANWQASRTLRAMPL